MTGLARLLEDLWTLTGAWDASRYDYARDRDPADLPCWKVLAAARVNPLGKLGQFTVYTVNGRYIREHLDLDFVSGGNPARYGYIPDLELWVGQDMDTSEWATIALHEYAEARLMTDEGLSHEEAHDQALLIEGEFRKAFPSATIPDVVDWLASRKALLRNNAR